MSLINSAKCPMYDFHGVEPEPTVPAGATMCIDTNGNTVARSITADTANRGKTTTTPDNSGGPFPPCDVCPLDQLRYEWCLFTGAPGVAAVVQTMDTLYSAFFPLQHGNESPLGLENHTYEERPLVVATLWLACGGATTMFRMLQAYLAHCIWVIWFTWWVLTPAALLVTSTPIAMNESFGAILGMSVAQTAFPGVWTGSAIVASALLSTPVLRDAINVLGVREAGTASILRMFAEGFKLRLTLTLFPGAFGLILHRQKLKLVVGRVQAHQKRGECRPNLVDKATSAVTDDEAQALSHKVQAAIIKLYNDHKPT
eukprot:jgi/Undpi1/106/HiC_scaffold_1.g00106.m1